MNKVKQHIIEYAKKMTVEKLLNKGDFISYRGKNGVYITKANTNLATLTEDDIDMVNLADNATGEVALHLAIYNNRADITAIIHDSSESAYVASTVGKAVPAVLDDFAQIVGYKVKVSKGNDPKAIIKLLKGKNSCLLLNSGALATGRSLEEAYTCALVLEKGCKCFIEASVLGGGKTINIIEAILMRFIYKKKYSQMDKSSLPIED